MSELVALDRAGESEHHRLEGGSAHGTTDRKIVTMKVLFAPVTAGVTAVRHIAWYVRYQVSGEARQRD
jgi:hypothetical protein